MRRVTTLQPSAQHLAGLARKYRALAELRRVRDAGGEAGGRVRLRRLAEEFPGCLRELDTLGLTELERRAARSEDAAAGGEAEAWMAWIHGYHALMRAALQVKREAGGGRSEIGDALAARLGSLASSAAGVVLDARFVRDVARPAQGRIGPVVLRELGARFGAAPAEIAGALFPLRRPSPYRLKP